MMPVELVLSKLPDAKPIGHGWQARCPAHDDRSPSLSIAEGDGGRALVKCHAGCTAEQVVAALGLEMKDLMPSSGSTTGRRPNSKPPRPGIGKSYPSREEALAAARRWKQSEGAIFVKDWVYERDAIGVVASVLRFNLPNPNLNTPGEKPPKVFVPISLHADGWRLKDPPGKWPLYGLLGLVRAPQQRVYLFEGEKTSDAGIALGLLATTSAHGSKSAKLTDWTPLAGRDVVIVPDHDAGGRAYAEDVARILKKLDPHTRVKIVDLPGLREHEDLVEFVADREMDGKDTLAIVTEIEELATRAPEWSDDAPVQSLEWRPFPIDALPAVLRDFVRESAKSIGCDPTLVALPVLAVIAACIGNTCRVLLKKGWSEAAVLWLATVANSGALKSPAMRPAVHPLLKLHEDEQAQYQQRVKDYELELARHELAVAEWKKNKGAGDMPLAPDRPSARRIVVADVTIEALAAILEANPRGLLLVRDELAAWIGSFDRYASGKGSDGPAWLSMYDAGPVIVDRKSGDPKSIYVAAAAVSVVGTIQPQTLRRVFSAEYRENGTLARVLVAAPPNEPALWTDAEVDEDVESRFNRVIDALLQLAPAFDENGNPRPQLIRLDESVKVAFIVWHDAHARETSAVSGDLAASFSKIKGACARIALLFHAVRVADGEAGVNPAMIDAVSMQSAIRLAEWFKHEARRVYAMLAEDETGRERRQNLEWIRRNGGSVSVREWQRMKSYSRKEDTEAELNAYVEAGFGTWVDVRPSERGGRPSRKFCLSAVSDTDKTPAGEAPREVLSVSEPADPQKSHGPTATDVGVAS